MEAMNRKRNMEVDMVKGLAIILMVIGHVETPAQNFIYLFHMAVFFIAAGYFYKEDASESISSVGQYIVKKIKGLWVPYALWTAVFSLLRNFFIHINVYTNNPLILETVNSKFAFVTEFWTWKDILINIIKGCILPGNVQVGGALWFLATLLQISIMYCVIEFVLKKFLDRKYIVAAQFVVAVVLLMIGYFLNLKDIYIFGIESFFSCYCLFYAGMLLHRFEDRISQIKPVRSVLLLVICFVLLCVLNNFGSIALGANNYNNPVFMLAASLAGWFLLYESASLIKQNPIIAKGIAYVGKNTLPIVVLHFLAFKLVSLVGVLVCGGELYQIAAFPVLYEGFGWRVLYTLVGVIVPLAVNEFWMRLKKKIRKI